MKRRAFLGKTGSAALGMTILSRGLFSINPSRELTASDLNTYLRSLIDVDEPSVDRISWVLL